MKKQSIFISLIFCSLYSFAQITTRDIVVKEEIRKPKIYDSTYFWYRPQDNENELKKYIGQSIFILPISKEVTDRKYIGFFDHLNEGYDDIEDLDNPLYPTEEIFSNKYLKVIDAYKVGKSWYLQLLFNSKDTIYYFPDSYILQYQTVESLPFIFSAFYTKTKNDFINKTFIAKEIKKAKDINTGDAIFIKKNESWQCVDVTLVDLGKSVSDFYTPVLIFRNSSNNEIIVNFAEYIVGEVVLPDRVLQSTRFVFRELISISTEDFYTLNEYQMSLMQKQDKEKKEALEKIKIEKQKQDIKKTYGDYYGSLVNNKKVVIGMTKEMCATSWGKPFSTEELTTENGKFIVWQYNYKTFLYFEDNILKIIKQ